MSILFKSAAVDIFYKVNFDVLSLKELKEDSRIDLVEKIAKKFDLRLNDIKISPELYVFKRFWTGRA